MPDWHMCGCTLMLTATVSEVNQATRKRHAGMFQPGPDPRRNVAGRPRRGHAWTEAVRRRVDPNELIDRALAIVEADGTSDKDRIAAMAFLHSTGYQKPAERHEIAAVQADEDDDALDAATDDEFDRLEALERERLAIVAGIRVRLCGPGIQPGRVIDVPVGSSTDGAAVANTRLLQDRDSEGLR